MRVGLQIVLMAVASGLAQLAWAGPSTLHIGSGYGTTCQNGGCPIYGNEVNNIGTLTNNGYRSYALDIYQTSKGAGDITGDLSLIIGVPNDSSNGNKLSTGTVTGATLYQTVGQTAGAALSVSSVAFNGLWDANSGAKDVYDFLSLGHINRSNNLTNWQAVDSTVDGINAKNFGIYVFDITLGNLTFGGGNYIDVALSGLGEGDFAVAYGTSGNKAYGTPFTEAGNVDVPAVPEPSGLATMGLGLVLLALINAISRKKTSPTTG